VRLILNIYQIYYEFIMFKDGLKKSTKHLMMISAIATLLITVMGITTTTNANAFNFGFLSLLYYLVS
jgi:tellurite resistance protein TehA-like permease